MKITTKSNSVGIIGLGYVGLPLACLVAEKGYTVIGFDYDHVKVESIRSHKSPFHDPELTEWLKKVEIHATTNSDDLKSCDIIIVCVPTPVDHVYKPDLRPVESAFRVIHEQGKPGVVAILESTVNPGVCEDVVMPILEADGKKLGQDFFLAHCPERIDPGNTEWNVRNIPRVIGGIDAHSTQKAARFYRSILEGTVREMQSIREAEAVKIVENSFRDINIAFVNEIARSFDRMGIDTVDVIRGASTKPFAFLAHYPSCGVGGHCIPVDPYYLIEKAHQFGFDHKFLALAREINNDMPSYTVALLQETLNELTMPIRETHIGVLGLSYKANIGDIRESPALKILEQLERLGARIHVFDPYFPERSTEVSVESLIQKSTAIILATNHREFSKITPPALHEAGVRVLIDGKNFFSKKDMLENGILYRGIGRS